MSHLRRDIKSAATSSIARRALVDVLPKASRSRPFSRTSAPARAAQAEALRTRALAADADADKRPASLSPSVPLFYSLFPETLPNGPPPSGPFAVDIRKLRREFLRLQAASHPDFHHSASGASNAESTAAAAHSPARRAAEAASATINEAYKTLSSPLLRAQYLLQQQHGIDLAADEAGSASGAADPEVLMAVLEAREAIEAAESEDDLVEVGEENEGRIRECEDGLATAFADGDVDAATGLAVRLRYWMNVRESIQNWEKGKEVVLQH
jgi:molecular chaperone HscB